MGPAQKNQTTSQPPVQDAKDRCLGLRVGCINDAAHPQTTGRI